MSEEPKFDRLFIDVNKAGLGQKHARGSGIGFRRLEDGQIEISIGRKSPNYWHSNAKATAWARLSSAEAHEMAHALMFLTGGQVPCVGEGIHETGKHKINLKVDIGFTV